LEQACPLPKANSLFIDECEERALRNWLNRLSAKKISWEQFNQKIANPLSVSRIASRGSGQSLLHLAVLDDRLDMVQALKRDASLKWRRDAVGLSPIELAQLLNRKEVLDLLQPSLERAVFPDFPPLENFEYLPHPIFETRESLEQVLACVAKAKQEDKISAEKIWMGIYFDKEVQNGVHPAVSIRHINSEIGYGVFAEKKIPPCAYVGEYTGVVQERTPKQLKEKNYCLRYPVWEGKKNFAIDAEEKGNFTRFINHSREPNLSLESIYWHGVPRMIFLALKEIWEGEPLTFDYGPLFWKGHESR